MVKFRFFFYRNVKKGIYVGLPLILTTKECISCQKISSDHFEPIFADVIKI